MDAARSAPAGADRFAFPALIAGSALLAFGPLLVRLASADGLAPMASAFWRMALAAGPLLLVALWLRRRAVNDDPRPGARPMAMFAGLAAAAGLFFAADLAAWHSGIVRTTLANATLFANTTAFMLAGCAMIARRRLPDAATLRALALAFAGTALLLGLSLNVSPQHLLGDMLCLLAAVFYTGYLLVIARVGPKAPMTTVAAVTLAGALWLWPMALLDRGDFWPDDWRPVLGLALSSQVLGQSLMIFAAARVPATVLGVGLLAQPVISATLGWAAFGEALTPAELAGAAMIAAALVLIRRANAFKDAAKDGAGERP